MYESFLIPLQSMYTLKFDNVLKPYMVDYFDYYDTWASYLFDHFEEMLLNKNYLLVIASMRENRDLFIGTLVRDIYDESCIAVANDIDEEIEDGVSINATTSNTLLYDYLCGRDVVVETNMFYIAYFLIINLFNQIHQLVIDAEKYNIRFQELRLTFSKCRSHITVNCITSTESIKTHDEAWYDRICMLTPV